MMTLTHFHRKAWGNGKLDIRNSMCTNNVNPDKYTKDQHATRGVCYTKHSTIRFVKKMLGKCNET